MLIYTRLEKESIVDFYNAVATQLGYNANAEDIRYNPNKINVSIDRSDLIEEKYKEIGEQKGTDWKLAFGMDWVCYGPHAVENLKYSEVELEDGFIYFDDGKLE